MTNPGDDAPQSASSEPTAGGFEAPPIEQMGQSADRTAGQSDGQQTPAYESPGPPVEQPGQAFTPPDQPFGRPDHRPPDYGEPYQAPSGYDPSAGYPPPPGYSAPPGNYPPYPPPQGAYPAPQGAYPPPYGDPSSFGGQAYPPPPYGAPAPYGAPSGYGAPYSGGYGDPGDTKTNSLAIGALVASAVGVLCGIGSIIGIVLGIVALNQIKASGEGGRGLAIAGIAVGAATLLFSIIVTISMLGI